MAATDREEGPVYYREIQKNAYLKRVPTDSSGIKIKPLGHKKAPLKPMWTLFCVHNGRTPYLEQYPDPESPLTLTHKPIWRHCLSATRLVTASVKPHARLEYDFLIDTVQGPVRMRAADWDQMQDWVVTLRTKLQELKILSTCENVYCPAPSAPVPRAGTRDPTSPLPPTPPHPVHRVPGIEITPLRTVSEQQSIENTAQAPQESQDHIEVSQPETDPENTESHIENGIDISNWDEPFAVAGTSQEVKIEPKKNVAKICGQNICLDDFLKTRKSETTESDEEFFAEIDRISESVEDLNEDSIESVSSDYKQTLVVSNNDKPSVSNVKENGYSEYHGTNITVIEVSNSKGPPHTAIPVMGPETDVFDFEFKHKLSVNEPKESNFINIVNTEDVKNENSYGTVFTKESDYGHLSLTTTVNVTDVKQSDTSNSGIYERLCMASTSNINKMPSPLPIKRIKSNDKIRKSSLPNLEVNGSESTYEYLFPNRNNNTTVTINHSNGENDRQGQLTERLRQSNDNIRQVNENSAQQANLRHLNDNVRQTNENLRQANENLRQTTENLRQTNENLRITNENLRQPNEYIRLPSETVRQPTDGLRQLNGHNRNVLNRVECQPNIDPITRAVRTNVERSHSQNSYDRSARLREHLVRRAPNDSPKREKNEKSETAQPKPIWKRGLTELSLLTRLRSIGLTKRQDSPTRLENGNDRSVTSPVKVVHRARAEVRVDSGRRRSSSFSSGQADSPPNRIQNPMPTLRQREAAQLVCEQNSGALVGRISTREPPKFAFYDGHVWVASWGSSLPPRAGGPRGHTGDRVAALRGTAPTSLADVHALLKQSAHCRVDILFHRVPLAKIFVVHKRDGESLGISIDSSCTIVRVQPGSPCSRAGLTSKGGWALTELNHRPLCLLKGGDEEINRLSKYGSEVSLLIQPVALVKKLRAALKGNRPLLTMR